MDFSGKIPVDACTFGLKDYILTMSGTSSRNMCKEAYEVQHSRAVVHAVTDCSRHGLTGHTPNHLLHEAHLLSEHWKYFPVEFCHLFSQTGDIPFGRAGSTLHPVFSGPTPACYAGNLRFLKERRKLTSCVS